MDDTAVDLINTDDYFLYIAKCGYLVTLAQCQHDFQYLLVVQVKRYTPAYVCVCLRGNLYITSIDVYTLDR